MAPHGRAVLIVEDESIIAHDVQQILSEFGYDAYAIAASAEEALARASERRPDIALVDIRIKGKLDGVKTAQLLQETHRVPVVYMTGHADDATIERVARTRPYGYLHKPVRAAELKSVMEIALYRHAQDGPRAAGDAGPAVRSPAADGTPASAEDVRLELERVLRSADLDASRRSREFLGFIVEEALEGRGASLTQAAIATRVFGRRDDFDPLLDPIVRIQAGRLRRSLERYYLLAGKADPVRIDIPRGSYAPVFGQVAAGAAEPVAPPPPSATQPSPAEDAGFWPSVAVRSFDLAAADDGSAETARCLQDELAMELGRYREVRVMLQGDAERLPPARQPRFEIGGRLRREGDGWLVTARLLDRATGEQVWSDEYHSTPVPGRWSGTPGDIARVVASRVAAEHGTLVRALWAENRTRPSAAGAYGAILRSHQFFFLRDVQDLPPAVEALREVVADQPEIAQAWMHLCRLYQVNYAFELSDLDTPIDQAVSHGYQGVRLDPTGVRMRSVLASALLIKGELAAALEELHQALRLNPGSLVHLEIVGYTMALAGDWDRGMALVRDAMERNPHFMPHAYYALWADHLRRGEFEKAYLAALEYRDPTFFWRALMRASALGHVGRTREARAEVAELLRQKPDFPARGRTLIGRFIKHEDLQERVAKGLRKAGLVLA